MLRDYQQRALDMLDRWFMDHDTGNPCLVLPTGAGKSHIIAAFCKQAITQWPETRILKLTHVKELIQQNAEKLRQLWPAAPLGVYSAGLGKRELGEPITFGGIQSLREKAEAIGHVDLVLVDECHLISHTEQGGYRQLLAKLRAINPALRVIGLTATPYRLGHGYITDGEDRLFTDLITPVSVTELVQRGFLAPLVSRHTEARFDLSGVGKRGGEYIESQLEKAVNNDDLNLRIAAEIVSRAERRTSWLVFCAGVAHAESMREAIDRCGVSAACITGDTPAAERASIIGEYKAGRIRCITNANVLTTGFDAPDTDLLAFLRPTESAALYVQMAGRGMRLKSHTDHCLVLDFAGLVARHGPIIDPDVKSRSSELAGDAPTKQCEGCGACVPCGHRACPYCGHEFPPPEPKAEPPRLRDEDIMGEDRTIRMNIKDWSWRVHTSRSSGRTMLAVTYYGEAFSDPRVTEYLAVLHDGFAGERARRELGRIAHHGGIRLPADGDDLESIADLLAGADPPAYIRYEREGKFFRVKSRGWEQQ